MFKKHEDFISLSGLWCGSWSEMEFSSHPPFHCQPTSSLILMFQQSQDHVPNCLWARQWTPHCPVYISPTGPNVICGFEEGLSPCPLGYTVGGVLGVWGSRSVAMGHQVTLEKDLEFIDDSKTASTWELDFLWNQSAKEIQFGGIRTQSQLLSMMGLYWHP